MRFLGFLFVIVLVFAAFGYFRGWFAVSKVRAGSHDSVVLDVDGNKIATDSDAAVTRLGELSARAVEQLRSIGRTVGASDTNLEGEITSVDAAPRNITLSVATQAITLHIPTSATISRAGVEAGFDQLRPAVRVQVTAVKTATGQRVTRVDILP